MLCQTCQQTMHPHISTKRKLTHCAGHYTTFAWWITPNAHTGPLLTYRRVKPRSSCFVALHAPLFSSSLAPSAFTQIPLHRCHTRAPGCCVACPFPNANLACPLAATIIVSESTKSERSPQCARCAACTPNADKTLEIVCRHKHHTRLACHCTLNSQCIHHISPRNVQTNRWQAAPWPSAFAAPSLPKSPQALAHHHTFDLRTHGTLIPPFVISPQGRHMCG